MQLILASTSPNRRELFDRMGIAYQALAPDYEEVIDHSLEPFEQVEAFALGKAESVKDRIIGSTDEQNNRPTDQLKKGEPSAIDHGLLTNDYLIMGFDSMIEFKGGSLGKAHSLEEARAMLQSFVGESQQVVSGFALMGRYAGKDFKIIGHQSTTCPWRSDITDKEIDHYLTFGDWDGKCGAYSILGPGIFFLDSIEGDFQNIVGVPVIAMGHAIKKALGVSWLELLQVKEPPSSDTSI